MNKAQLLLANFDARIKAIKIKPQNIHTKIVVKSKMYDESIQKEIPVKIQFKKVAAIDFQINYFDNMIGAEAMGLYCIDDLDFIESIIQSNFHRRKDIYLRVGHYDYDEHEEADLLNCLDLAGRFQKHKKDYKAYIQNVDAGIYIIIAKDIKIKRGQ